MEKIQFGSKENIQPVWLKGLSEENRRALIDLSMGAGINATHSKFVKESDVPRINELMDEYLKINYEEDFEKGGPEQKKVISELKKIFYEEH